MQFPHLLAMARQSWDWYELRNIMIIASYIASIDSTIADRESRTLSVDTEWSLSQEAFSYISLQFGPFNLDLFASIISAKCEIYVS